MGNQVRLSSLTITFISFISFAGTATQTDWSGGPGVQGPVLDWNADYYSDSGIQCYSVPGALLLEFSSTEYSIADNFEYAVYVNTGDVNGDDYQDVLGAAYQDQSIKWWENTDGSGLTWSENQVDSNFNGASSVVAAYVNDDSYLDILASASEDDEIAWWENTDGTGTNWIKHSIDYVDCPLSICIKDIDGDNDEDVICASYHDLEIAWWEKTDSSGDNWIKHIVDGDFDSAYSAYAEDVDSDGDMDILGAATFQDDITWWENENGIGTIWIKHEVETVFLTASCVYSEDINGDGHMDIIGTEFNGEIVSWWENADGIGTNWIEHSVDTSFGWSQSVRARDINADGDIDIFGAAGADDEITWWENSDGSGTNMVPHIVDSDFDGAISVCEADLNDDGKMDIVGASSFEDRIAWWEVLDYPGLGCIESSILDVQDNPDWGWFEWNSLQPVGTSVAFQVRASDNSSNMGLWSDTLFNPCDLDGIIDDSDSLFQYKAIFSTNNSDSTPILQDVSVIWSTVETGDNPDTVGCSTRLYPIYPNPSYGSINVQLSIPDAGMVEICLFDISGRIVYSSEEDFQMGFHTLSIPEPNSGIYFVMIQVGSSRKFRSVIVL